MSFTGISRLAMFYWKTISPPRLLILGWQRKHQMGLIIFLLRSWELSGTLPQSMR
uniref:Uncharacterized protein n=1 Tax=Arundo donax TaxID=35708 RepID=A0A0A9FBK2_ARUDO